MGRVIKFRAWDKRFNMMIYQLADGYRFAFNGDIEVISQDLTTFRVSDEFEVMQFTGLTDRNGKEIYEGDIINGWIEDESIEAMPIIYDEGAFSVKVSKDNPFIPPIYLINDMKVIGNVFEDNNLIDKG